MSDLKVIRRIRQKYARLAGEMDQRLRRQWAALEAKDLGWGGVRKVSLATGLARRTILVGTRELDRRRTGRKEKTPVLVRSAGKGRKPLIESDPGLRMALDALVNPNPPTSGPLRWTCQSTAKLAQELQRQNHPVSDRTVASVLKEAGYSLQDRRKCNELSSHTDRDVQFEHINRQAASFQIQEEPVVWVIARKKELSGQSMETWKQRQASGSSPKRGTGIPAHGATSRALPEVNLDLTRDRFFVNKRIDGETMRFTIASIGRWWREMGVKHYPGSSRLLILADAGESNSACIHLWKAALQDLANELRLTLEICRFPPGTTKWHKIEHSLLSYITQEWRGQTSVSYEVKVHLIARRTSTIGPNHRALPDRNHYRNGNSVADAVVVQPDRPEAKFHNEWNYVIHPVI